jgi:hypothetical protein
LICLKPGSGSLAGRCSSVMVSPTGRAVDLLDAGDDEADLAGRSVSLASDFGVKRPSLSTWCARPSTTRGSSRRVAASRS